MIERFNLWIEKVGVDKLLHFLVAAWVVAEFKAYGYLFGFIGFILVCILAVVKELWLDEKADINDAFWSVFGGFFSLFLMLINMLVL